jgi:hypothetical protein
MKYSLLTTTLLAFSSLALALDRPPEAAERLRHDLALIQNLVNEGLNLAAEEDPILRARICNKLAGDLVQEIQKAAATKDEKRAAHLGGYLKTVLVRGVAGSLDLARRDLPQDSPRQPELQSVSDQTVRVTQPVADEKYQVDPNYQLMQPALDAVNQGRQAVDNALKGKAKGKGKSKGKGKGKS